ncbi:hypothetical protein GCM10011511_52560 [Puia dinghuensis]|uniref:RHS repeat protein n=2 Tax=Puia dinghuensis TaxID=1792502 RepID=A0A8J2XW86_9BACT|nr:hypothetical protein GCM10011511_52560 [Puia dinghuensis]
MIAKTDQWGKVVSTSHFVPVDKNTVLETAVQTGRNPYAPCFGRRYVFKDGLLSEYAYVDEKGDLCNNRDGYAREVLSKYDTGVLRGFTRSFSYFNAAGKPVLAKNVGYHQVVLEHDDRGNIITRSYLNKEDAPMANKYGVYKIQYTYDQWGNNIQTENKALDGTPLKGSYGAATYKTSYKDGWRVQEEMFDDQGHLTTFKNIDGRFAVVTYKRDDRGNVMEEAYYGDKREPVNDERGIHLERSSYSDDDLLLERSFWDKEGKATTDLSLVHAYRYTYDKDGNRMSKAFLDTAGRLFNRHYNHVNMIRYQYYASGSLMSESYWNNDHEKTVNENGHHQKAYQYDETGQLRAIDLLDSLGEHVLGDLGYSREVLRYNSAAQLQSRSYFDAGRPISQVKQTYYVRNYHTIRYEYDSLNRVRSVIYLDEQDRPFNATVELGSGEIFPCSKVVFEYNASVLVAERIYTTNPDEAPVMRDCMKQYAVSTSGQGRLPPDKQ